MREKPMIRWRVILLWILGILLPMAWFGRFCPAYARIFGFLFGPLWMHLLMHAFLFAVLGWLVAHGMRHALPVMYRVRLPGALVVVAVIALLQEGIQPSYKARPWGRDEMLDVAVDIGAGAVGAAVCLRQGRARH